MPYYYPFSPQPIQPPVQQPIQQMQPVQQQMQPMSQSVQQMNQNQEYHNGGFTSVRSEEVALNWPIAPGNYMTFKIQDKPIVIEKSMGFSQLENPRIRRYKLVEEDIPEVEPAPISLPQYALQDDFNSLKDELSELRESMDLLMDKFKEPVRRTRKKEEE